MRSIEKTMAAIALSKNTERNIGGKMYTEA
jgi:hypothetical protein